MFIHLAALAAAALLLAADPVTILLPHLRLSLADRQALANGDPVAGTLQAPKDQIGVFAIARTNASGETLLNSARAIEDLERSSFVTAIRRFSEPPVISDLEPLVLSPRDVDAVLACEVGSCSFKFTEREIGLLRSQLNKVAPLKRREHAQAAFRNVVLARVQAYLAGGLASLSPIVNRGKPFCLDDIFTKIMTAASPIPGAPCTADWLGGKAAAEDHIESFLYWSQETYGAGKPVVTVTHVGLVSPKAPGEPWLVLGKQIFASRYMMGGFALTALTSDSGTGERYLVYVNRTAVDLLGGFFAPLKRSMLESALKRQGPEIIGKLRQRLERNPPPASR